MQGECGTCGERSIATLRLFVVARIGTRSLAITICGECQAFIDKSRDTNTFYEELEPELNRLVMLNAPEPVQLKDIARLLNESGRRTIRGTEWTANSVYNALEKLGIDRSLQSLDDSARVPLPMATALPTAHSGWGGLPMTGLANGRDDVNGSDTN